MRTSDGLQPVGQRATAPSPAPRPSGLKAGAALVAAVGGILAGIYANEGGFVDHPDDPGGATRYGVTEKVARAAGYRGDMRWFPKHCEGPVTICADDIYLRDYIAGPGFLPVIEADPAVGGELVDSAVNFGPRPPSCWFQQAMNELGAAGLKVDCRIGPRTVGAYRALQLRVGAVPACVRTLDRLDAKQRADYERQVRVNPRKKVFLKGWLAHRIGNIDRKTCGKGIA